MSDLQGGTEAGGGAAEAAEHHDLPGAAEIGSADTDAARGAAGEGAGPTEEERARQALLASAEVRQRAVEAFSIGSWLAQSASIALRYGNQDPAYLANALAGMQSWTERATDALRTLGEDIDRPAPLPSPAAVSADLDQVRAMAYAHLMDLASYARSHAEIIAKMPDDAPALISIGRSMTETFNAANGAILGMGMLMRAKPAA